MCAHKHNKTKPRISNNNTIGWYLVFVGPCNSNDINLNIRVPAHILTQPEVEYTRMRLCLANKTEINNGIVLWVIRMSMIMIMFHFNHHAREMEFRSWPHWWLINNLIITKHVFGIDPMATRALPNLIISSVLLHLFQFYLTNCQVSDSLLWFGSSLFLFCIRRYDLNFEINQNRNNNTFCLFQ